MTSSSAAQPPHTKLIDFGFMLDLSTASSRACASPSSFDTVVTDILVGTEGFFAPESLSKCEYSRKSDIWQLGCVLYAMLVGYHPFSTQKRYHSFPCFLSLSTDLSPRYRSSILSGSYFPMTTADWQEISSQGKDLVSKLLQVKPCDRLELEDILKHPWIASRSSEASPSSWETGLGEGYHERMKLLASHRLQYLPLGMSQSDADTKLSQLVTESAEKRQKVDHSEGKTEADGCELRSVSPVQLRRAESEKKGDPQSAAAVKPSGDRSCRSSPSLEKQADEELLSNCGGK
jgi:serine/threonine protein kinase